MATRARIYGSLVSQFNLICAANRIGYTVDCDGHLDKLETEGTEWYVHHLPDDTIIIGTQDAIDFVTDWLDEIHQKGK